MNNCRRPIRRHSNIPTSILPHTNAYESVHGKWQMNVCSTDDRGCFQRISVCYTAHLRASLYDIVGPTSRAVFKTVGALGQDIFRGDVSSCQTHFFRRVGGVAKLHLVGALFGGARGMCSVCPDLNPAMPTSGSGSLHGIILFEERIIIVYDCVIKQMHFKSTTV